jgi:hypothetical protein
VAAVSSDGSKLTYATYLGDGQGAEGQPQEVSGMATHGTGNVYVTGFTDWTNFPAVRAICPAAPIGGNAFVAWIATTPTLGGGANASPEVCPTAIPTSQATRGSMPAGCISTAPDNEAPCGCRVAGARGSSVAGWWTVALVCVGAARRRRNLRRPRPSAEVAPIGQVEVRSTREA